MPPRTSPAYWRSRHGFLPVNQYHHFQQVIFDDGLDAALGHAKGAPYALHGALDQMVAHRAWQPIVGVGFVDGDQPVLDVAAGANMHEFGRFEIADGFPASSRRMGRLQA